MGKNPSEAMGKALFWAGPGFLQKVIGYFSLESCSVNGIGNPDPLPVTSHALAGKKAALTPKAHYTFWQTIVNQA
jgi:hypothetical protein